MQSVQEIAETIKALAKGKGISVKQMLVECGVNKNAIVDMSGRGSWPSAETLAKLADYLGCSVDYLLGRDVSDLDTKKAPPEMGEADTALRELIRNFEDLNPEGREKLLGYSDDLVTSGKYIKTDDQNDDRRVG